MKWMLVSSQMAETCNQALGGYGRKSGLPDLPRLHSEILSKQGRDKERGEGKIDNYVN